MILYHRLPLGAPNLTVEVEIEVEFGAFSYSNGGPRAFCPIANSYAIMQDDRTLVVNRLGKPQDQMNELDEWVESHVFNLDPEMLGYEYKTLYEEYMEEQEELAYQSRQARLAP